MQAVQGRGVTGSTSQCHRACGARLHRRLQYLLTHPRIEAPENAAEMRQVGGLPPPPQPLLVTVMAHGQGCHAAPPMGILEVGAVQCQLALPRSSTTRRVPHAAVVGYWAEMERHVHRSLDLLRPAAAAAATVHFRVVSSARPPAWQVFVGLPQPLAKMLHPAAERGCCLLPRAHCRCRRQRRRPAEPARVRCQPPAR